MRERENARVSFFEAPFKICSWPNFFYVCHAVVERKQEILVSKVTLFQGLAFENKALHDGGLIIHT